MQRFQPNRATQLGLFTFTRILEVTEDTLITLNSFYRLRFFVSPE